MGTSIKKILILAGDTDGNIGDRAIVFSTCEELRRLDPEIRISLVSGNPRADRSFFGAEAIPRGLGGLPFLARAALTSDLVLCGGGGLFQDDASLVKMPYWALRIALARCLARRVVGYSLGVGPLDQASSRIAARLAFACMHEISVRDDLAKAIAEQLTSKPVHRVPDPALMLPAASEEDANCTLKEAGVPLDGSPVIGVAARRWFHHRATLIPHKYAVKYRLRKVPGAKLCSKMITLLAQVLDRLAEGHRAHILFLPSYNVPHEADDRICDETMRAMRSQQKSLTRIFDPSLYKAVAGRLSVMLGSRMHPAMFAVAMGTPVVGLSYNLKFEGFFRLMGHEDKLIPLEDFVHNEMVDELTKLLAKSITEGRSAFPRVSELVDDTRQFTARLLNAFPRTSDGLLGADS
jgi:polysaccharide pyruvyl transferase WcaK-like protein